MNNKINKVAELMQSNHDLRDELEKQIKEKEDMETRMFNMTLENENLAQKVEEYEAIIFKGAASPSNSPKKGAATVNALTVDSSPMRGRRSTNKPNVKSDFFGSEDSNNDEEERERLKKEYVNNKTKPNAMMSHATLE